MITILIANSAKLYSVKILNDDDDDDDDEKYYKND